MTACAAFVATFGLVAVAGVSNDWIVDVGLSCWIFPKLNRFFASFVSCVHPFVTCCQMPIPPQFVKVIGANPVLMSGIGTGID